MKKIISLLIATFALSSGVFADVKDSIVPLAPEFPTEVERRSAIATMQANWRALMEALLRGDDVGAAKLMDPEMRTKFMEGSIRRLDLAQVREALAVDLECEERVGLHSSQCSYWIKNAVGGLDEVRVPFVRRENQWYVSQ